MIKIGKPWYKQSLENELKNLRLQIGTSKQNVEINDNLRGGRRKEEKYEMLFNE